MPPSRNGDSSRHRRRAWPSPIAAAVIGFSGSRGSWSERQGSGTTIVSTGPSRGIPRSEIPRRSASACETAGGPASTVVAASERPMPCSAWARERSGSALTMRRTGEAAGACRSRATTGSRGRGR